MLMVLGAAMTASALTAILVRLLLNRGGGGGSHYHITLDQREAVRRF